MFIKIITVGKLKHDTFEKLADEYLKQINWNVEVVELKEDKSTEVKKKIANEGKAIAEKLEKGFLNVILDVDGREFSSLEFASFMGEIKDFENGKICFVIGGAFGLTEEFKKTFDMRISFGKMTLTHQFVRVILLEQLYRAWAILNGKKYHY
jgi:23S rRNA (pseudouridine1915-N3)-methyltransferase